MTPLPGPRNPEECHLYVAEGCHLYIAATGIVRPMADVRWAAFNIASKGSVWRKNAFHLQRAVISTRSGRSDVDTIDVGMGVPGRGLRLMLARILCVARSMALGRCRIKKFALREPAQA